jgi:hypothetical protein
MRGNILALGSDRFGWAGRNSGTDMNIEMGAGPGNDEQEIAEGTEG